MIRPRFRALAGALWIPLLALYTLSAAAQVNADLFSGMKWRQIGPFRGGRVVAVSGVPGDPSTWYFGAVAGGVWKSTNAGVTWQPLFDRQKIASVGAIAVADSDHNVIYVGTGEACPRGNITYGDGVYKSLDAGKTWQRRPRLGSLPLERWRRHLDPDQPRPSLPAARLVLFAHLCRPSRARHGVRAEYRRVPLDQWRQGF